MLDQTTRNVVDGSLANIEVNVLRFKQSLDDPTLLFWRPWGIKNYGEWPYVFFLKLEEGRVLASSDLGAPI